MPPLLLPSFLEKKIAPPMIATMTMRTTSPPTIRTVRSRRLSAACCAARASAAFCRASFFESAINVLPDLAHCARTA